MKALFKNYYQYAAVFFAGITLLTGCLNARLPLAAIKTGDGRTLSWQAAVEQALRNNPDLLAAKRDIQSSARSRDIVRGDFLPEVTGSLERERLRTTNTQPMRDSLGVSVSAEQPLFTGFETTGAYWAARKDVEAAEWNYQQVSAEVFYRLRSSFVELLKLKELKAVSMRIDTRRKQNADMIRLRYEAGRENLGSSLRAQAVSAQAVYTVRQLSRSQQSQSLLFGREIGGDFDMNLQPEGNLIESVPELPKTIPDFAALAEKTPQVQKALKNAESLKALVLAAQGALWPRIDGTLGYGYTGDRASNLRDDMSLGLRVAMPFFSGGANIAAVRKAKADYESALETARSVRDQAVADLADAWASWADAVEFVEVRRQFLEASRKRAEIVKAQYETGLANFQEFDIAEQELDDGEKNYVESLAAALIREANWNFVRGTTLEDVFSGKV